MSEADLPSNPANIKQPLIIVISGPSGVGKDAIIKRLAEMNVPFHFVVTATSRCPREGERPGVDYHFFSPEEFRRRLNAGEFIEYALVYDQYKGVLRCELTDALASGQDVIMRVDVQGARTLRRILPDAIFVFLTVENETDLYKRLQRRCSESEETLHLRLAKARQEMASLEEFDYGIVNQEGRLDEAAQQLAAIITAEKCRGKQRQQRIG